MINSRSFFKRGRFILMMPIIWIVPLMILSAAYSADPVPTELKDFRMGMSESALVEKIKDSGKISNEDSIVAKRRIVTWTPSNSPYYQTVSFRFTEKSRLFIVHLILKDDARQEAQSLKKSFFDKFKFAWEDPYRLRIKESDVLLYGEGDANFSFLDFTDVKTGAKAFELFSKIISMEDRVTEPPADKTGQEASSSEESTKKEPPTDSQKEPAKVDPPASKLILETPEPKSSVNSDQK